MLVSLMVSIAIESQGTELGPHVPCSTYAPRGGTHCAVTSPQVFEQAGVLELEMLEIPQGIKLSASSHS